MEDTETEKICDLCPSVFKTSSRFISKYNSLNKRFKPNWFVMNVIIIMIKCFISIYFQSIMFSMKYEWSKFALKIWKASIRHYFIKRNHITIRSIYYNIVVTLVSPTWPIVSRLCCEFYKTRNFWSSAVVQRQMFSFRLI